MSTNIEQDPEIINSWNKLADTAKKAGYRDGTSDGREKVFQKSFDEGYLQGFTIGFALGQYKGVLQGNGLSCDEHLEHSRRGLCQLCQSSNVTENSIQDLIQKQTDVSNSTLRSLHLKYSSQVTIKLKNEL